MSAFRVGSLRDGGRDGRLVALSADHARWAPGPAPTLQAALEDWEAASAALAGLAGELDAGGGEPVQPGALHAPLPRAYQYCEGSTYLTHMERCRAARGAALPPGHGTDLAMLQGGSDRFLAPTDPIELADEAWGLDIEPTVAVIVGDVPMGAGPDEACAAVRLVVLANDLTLRAVLRVEAAKGIGFFQAKPLRPFAPIALTPAALGDAWDGKLLHATVKCFVNGGQLNALDTAADASFDFGQVLAHAAKTRPLAAGTVVGTGTISNRDDLHGVGCLAEKRALEELAGAPLTPFLRPGDRIRIEAFGADGQSLFGAMETAVIAPRGLA